MTKSNKLYFRNDVLEKSKSVMLFDLGIEGHHANYIRYIIEYWIQNQIHKNLFILVTSKFLEIHSNLLNLKSGVRENRIKFLTISSNEEVNLKLQETILSRAFFEWNIFCDYANQLKIDEGLLMYFDYFQIPIIFGKRSPCRISGIYFRPTLHYKFLSSYKFSWKESLRDLRKNLILRLALKQPQLKTLFCLDPLAIEHMQKFNSKTKVIYLPDPMEPHIVDPSRVKLLREGLNIQDSEKKILLLFGVLDDRKGIYQVLEAVQKLDINVSSQICLLFVGKVALHEKEKFQKNTLHTSNSCPVEIHVRDEFVPDEDVKLYFEIADLILIPYQQHVGMSGVFLHAVAAKKPLISSDYGLLGYLTRQYHLGLSIDCSSSEEIKNGVLQCIVNQENGVVNSVPLDDLIAIHQYTEFSRVIFEKFN